MIEIKNVKKYFKSKGNKINAIDNTTLKLEDNGLVALLGASGSGKTSLLNALGGLDKVNDGKIFINGENITSNSSSKVDKIRNNNIGYIFQDYKLIGNLTVFENVEIVLKMIGVKDKAEIEKRVLYVLEKVNMLRYKRRPCSMLSGGEKQRVAIARALVKNPDIILADEPTGNLDSKNSLEIMKIISSIAKDRLVVLVTHERELATFYSTRIIEIVDGKVISDKENKDIDELDYNIENRIYLKDFDNIDTVKNKNMDINIYKNKEDKLDIDLIIKNGNIYIKSNSKVEVIDNQSSIEIVDDHYKKISKEEIDKYSFDLNSVISNNDKKYSSIFNPFTLFKAGFKKVLSYSLLKKILLLGFFVSAMFTLFGISSYLGVRQTNEDEFLSYDKNYVITTTNLSMDMYDAFMADENINFILPSQTLTNAELVINNLYQIDTILVVDSSVSTTDQIEGELYSGTMPENNDEIIIDLKYVEKLYNENSLNNMGMFDYEDLIGQNIRFYNSQEVEDFKYTITGIYDGGNPSIYLKEEAVMNFLTFDTNSDKNVLSYESLINGLKISKGRLPQNKDEIVLYSSYEYEYALNSTYKINNKEYKVVGYFSNNEYKSYFFVNNYTLTEKLFSENKNISLHVDDKEEAIELMQNNSIFAKDAYEESLSKYNASRNNTVYIISIIALVTLLISFIQIFIISRASFLSRIKEVGIYRAIGVKKMDIYKMFFAEVFVITLLVSVPGVFTMSYVITNITFLKELVLINPFVIILSIVLLFIINLFVSIIPVDNTIRKTPAYILSRTDID